MVGIVMSPKKKNEKSQAIRKPEFGQRVKSIRKHLKLKQAEMADKLELSLASISDIETGKSYPCYDFFYNMVEHFNVNLYYLLFGRGEMFVLPGAGSPGKEGKNENEMSFIVSNKDTREFLDYFFRSRVVQYKVLGYFYNFLNTDRKSIQLEIESSEKEKSGPGKKEN
jgi:transcriptional regulator with XRE-family HTH domain